MRRPLILAIVVGTFLTLPLAAQNCTDTVTWTGAVNTDWNIAGNWSPARVPTQSDTVTIPVGKTVTNQPGAGLGTGFICSLTLDGTLTIDTSALILLSTTVTSTLNNLTLTAAQGTSGLTVNGSATFTGNLMLNPGQVSGPGMATINGTVKVGKGPSFLTTATVNNEGSIAVTQDGVQLTLGTGVFNNDGTIALQGDGITVVGGGAFENSRFGSITKSKGPGASSFSSTSQFSTAGTVSGQTGTLVFSASGTSTGAFNADGTLQFANRVTMNAGTTVGGAGTIDIVAGGVWDVETPLTVNSGQLIFDGAAGNLILGNSDVTINSQVTWNGGWLGTSGGSAKATFTKNVTIATATSHASFRSLDIFATVNMNADLSMNAPNSTAPTVTIEPGATFNIGTDNGIHGQCTINNGGTFAKTGGSQVSVLDYSGTFNTLDSGKPTVGMVSVTSGVLDFATSNGGEIGGDWTVSAPATLEFGAGNYALAQGTVFSGSGTTLLTVAGNWTVEAAAFVNSSVFDFGGALGGGIITGEGQLTVNSPTFSWEGSAPGTMQGTGSPIHPGVTNISSGTTLTIRSGNKNVIGRAIFNAGTTKIADSSALFLGGLGETDWNNLSGSTFSFDADGNIYDGGGGTTFNNDGAVRKTGGTSSFISINGTFNNNAGGRVVAASGTIFLSSTTGTSAGAFVTQGASTRVLFDGGNWAIKTGTTMSGAGTIGIVVGVWTLEADLTVTSTSFRSAHLASINGPFDLTLNSSNITLGGTRTGAIQNGQPVGTLSIPKRSSVVTVQEALGVNMCTFDSFSNNMTINSMGSLSALNSSVVLNEKGGKITLDIPPPPNGAPAAIVLDGSSRFSNSGTVTLGSDSDANPIQLIEGLSGLPVGRFDNDGMVSVPASRTLDINVAAGLSRGTYSVGGGGTLYFLDGTFTLETGTVLTGAGTINLSGTFLVESDTTVSAGTFQFGPEFSVNGGPGAIQGPANLTIVSPTAGCDGGRIAMDPGAAVNLSAATMCTNNAAAACSISGGTVNNAGTMDLDNNSGGGVDLGGSATLNNKPGGTIDLKGKNGISSGGGAASIQNQGTLQCTTGSSGTCTVDINGPVSNSGSVTVQSGSLAFGSSSSATPYTQTGGTTSVSSGAILSDTQLITVNGGVIGGSGTINGNLNNVSGTLEAGGLAARGGRPASGTGILNLSGGEKQGPNSTLLVVIAGTTPGTQYDQINEANSIVGNGTLKFQFASGFTPAPTNTFDIVNFASGSGTLKNVITNSPTCKAVLVPTTKALNVKFTSTNVSVNINPPTVTLHENQQQQFTDTVSNGCGSGVTWKVNESNGGTVDQNGLYTAPARTGTFHVVVTSIADPSKFAFSTVTVIAARNQLVVTPPAALLQPGTTLLLRANRPVMWSIAEGKSAGSVSVGGRYTAPLRPGLYHVVATSTTDPSQHAVANISVVGGKLKSAYVANIDKDLISVLLPGSDTAATGPLHETASVATGQKPSALALSPKGKFLLSANADANDVSVFAISAASRTLHAVAGASSATGAQPSAVAFDPSGKFAFTTNSGSDDVSIFSVAASGQLTLLGSHALPAGEAPRALAAHPQGSLVFVAGSNAIHGFTLNAGSLKEIAGSPLIAGTAPTALTMDASGQFLFVANHDSGDISVFSIDAEKESLRQVSGSPFQAGKAPVALALDLTGSYLFVADHDSDDITTFQIDGETGALNRLGRTPLPTAGPSALAVDPSGQSLYVVSDQSASMTTLRLDVATGMLTATGKTQGHGKASSIVLAGSSSEKP